MVACVVAFLLGMRCAVYYAAWYWSPRLGFRAHFPSVPCSLRLAEAGNLTVRNTCLEWPCMRASYLYWLLAVCMYWYSMLTHQPRLSLTLRSVRRHSTVEPMLLERHDKRRCFRRSVRLNASTCSTRLGAGRIARQATHAGPVGADGCGCKCAFVIWTLTIHGHSGRRPRAAIY